jgi:hypothetical protein
MQTETRRQAQGADEGRREKERRVMVLATTNSVIETNSFNSWPVSCAN